MCALEEECSSSLLSWTLSHGLVHQHSSTVCVCSVALEGGVKEGNRILQLYAFTIYLTLLVSATPALIWIRSRRRLARDTAHICCICHIHWLFIVLSGARWERRKPLRRNGVILPLSPPASLSTPFLPSLCLLCTPGTVGVGLSLSLALFLFRLNTAQVGAGDENDKAGPVIPTNQASVDRLQFFSPAGVQRR